MQLVTPELGLIFWMTITFLLLFVILKKFAWPVIVSVLNEREQTITQSLANAEQARKDLQESQANRDRLVREAQMQHDLILREARQTAEHIVTDAKKKADAEYQRLLNEAKQKLQLETFAVMTELKNEVASFSLEIAEKVIQQELSDPKSSEALAERLVENLHFV